MATTSKKVVNITAPSDVKKGRLQGAQYADSLVNKAKQGGGKKEGKKAKIKIVRPPEGGWK